MKKRTSIIWLTDKNKLIEIVNKSSSISAILLCLGLINKGHNYRTLKHRLDEDAIDYSHIKLGLHSNEGRAFNREKTPLEVILVEHSTFNRNHLKIRLL